MFAINNWWWVSKPILVIDQGPCPTLDRSISFPFSQLQCAAQSVRSFVCPCVVLFLLWSSLSKMFHQCLTSVSPVFNHYFTSVSSVFHKCFTYVSQVSYQCLTIVSPVSHHCFTSVSPVFHQCFISVTSVFYQCFTCVVLKSSQLPKHMEGSFVFIYAFVCVCLACHK